MSKDVPLTQVKKMESGDDFVSKRRTRQQSLKHMVEIVEKRDELSQSGDSTNGRKRKKMENSGVENNGRRKFSRGTSEYLTKQSCVEEVSDDDDSSSEETGPDPDVDVDIVEEEEGSDPDVVIVAEEEEEELEEDEDEETDPDATSYYKSEIE
ncbi:acidic leucine-rich nuclear phosphoprotein 32 family member B-like [Solanum pennellii]|uniref:Acidic leucine-rich nuclear phosphoprotein 32 family member B-like n=1 Tax=Solanum pennellii TaxID=28526 RepID=A0ABM1VGY3_SOLPN|nr:acidic leucine-rich nuclear phosphoprotein 32 family member B-like [Solanum pennellii]